MVTKDIHRQAASHALGGFQMLEKHLKDYIGIHHKLVALHLPPGIAYRFTGQEVLDAPLGKLVAAFDARTTNRELVSQLRKLLPARNELAHRSLSTTYGDRLSPEELHAQSEGFVRLAKEVAAAMREVLSEQRFLVEMYGIAIDSSDQTDPEDATAPNSGDVTA